MLGADEIRRVLRHAPPFLMVDEVLSLDERGIVAAKDVRADDPNVAAHYPDAPLMPGVLIIEALAQAGGLLAYHLGDYEPDRERLLFMGVEQARFRLPVRPGERLLLEVEALRRGRIYRLAGTARVDGAVVADAILQAAIRPAS